MTPQSTIITSTGNRRIVDTRKLSQRKYRDSQGQFLVEGLQLLHMALDAGHTPSQVFYCRSLFRSLEADRLLRRIEARQTDSANRTELVSVSASVLRSLSPRCASQGIVATFPCFHHRLQALKLTGVELVVVLDHLQDPGNTGTLIRAADAVGAAAIILLEPCPDIFDPRAVRSSMGSLFNLPVACANDVADTFRWLRSTGMQAVAADPYKGIDWGWGLWQPGTALVLGNEARGLSDEVREEIDAWARLPMVGKAESLNVAIAGGVLMYNWLAAMQR